MLPLRSSVQVMTEKGVSHGEIERHEVNDAAARLNRPFSGRANSGLCPDLQAEFVFANKAQSLMTEGDALGEFSLCLVHELTGWTDACGYVIDTCLPILAVCRRLESNGIRCPLVVSLNASLLTYLASPEAAKQISAELAPSTG